MKMSYPVIRCLSGFVCCLTLLVGYSGTGFGNDAPISSYIPGEILVKFKSGAPEDKIQRFRAATGVIGENRLALTGVRRLTLPAGLSVEEAVAQYRANPDVEYVEPNYTRRALASALDPDLDRQWGLENTGQTLSGTFPPLRGKSDADIDAREAWDVVTGSRNLVIAVIDSGVDYTHPDLSSNIWTNPGEEAWSDPQDPATGDHIDTDGNSLVDDWKGWNFVGSQVCTIGAQGQCDCNSDDPIGNNDPMDDFGHGTPAAGVMAAQGNNQVGVAGVLWTAQIMPLKFLDAVGCGNVGDEIQAIDYAVRKGARIITVNAGGGAFQQAEFDAIAAARDAGVLFVAPAGNGRSDNDAAPVYPANYELSNVISVAASDFRDNLAFFSNYGRNSVDLAAPGDCIFSTMPTGTFTLQNQTNLDCTSSNFLPNYDYNTGTSFAASFVAGIAGMLLVQNPALTPSDLKAVLVSTSDSRDSFKGRVVSGGRVNAHRALIRDTGSTFSGGRRGAAGCGVVDLIGGDGPVSPGTAAVFFLVMVFPLLLASRKARRMLKSNRGSMFFFIGIAALFGFSSMTPAVYAQVQEDTQMTHQIALKMGFHLYRSSEYFDANSKFFDENDLTSVAQELQYDYLWFSPSSLSFAVGSYDGKTDFKTICCSRVEFRNLYARTTLKFHVRPVKLKPLEFYFGPGIGYDRFNRRVTVLDAGAGATRRAFDLHVVAGAELRLSTRLSLLLESRYASATIRHANDLDNKLNIGGVTTFFGAAWQFPDFSHLFPTRVSEKAAPVEVTEERVIPPAEKPLEERPAPEVEAPPEEKSAIAAVELEQIHFDFDEWNIPEHERSVLEQNAQWLQAHKDANVVLEGHCDQRGTNEYNLALGQRRAEAVKRVLVTLGIDEKRLSIISYGEERLVCFDSTEACFARNRRVQFTIK